MAVCRGAPPTLASLAMVNPGFHISASDLAALITKGTPPAILDVRSREEFAQGHIPGALHVPFWKFLFGKAPASIPRREPLVVYCGHGPRARLAKAGLWGQGFRNVIYLAGHMSGWKRAGLPQERA
jgi:rhodanese-related sulfurtransferase